MEPDAADGVSPLRSAYRNAWYAGVLQRYNEAIAMDYMIPFRSSAELAMPAPFGVYKNSNGKPADLTMAVRGPRRRRR